MSRLLRLGSDFTWEMDQPRPAHLPVAVVRDAHAAHGRGVHAAGQARRPDLRQGRPVGAAAGRPEGAPALSRSRDPFRHRETARSCSSAAAASRVFDATGRHLGWWGVSRNATAEVLAQRELQRSQAMLDRLFRLSPDAVCVASMRDGRVLLANPAFLQFVGLDEAQVMGRNGLELGFWRDDEPMLALGRAIAAQGWVRDFRSVAWSRRRQRALRADHRRGVRLGRRGGGRDDHARRHRDGAREAGGRRHPRQRGRRRLPGAQPPARARQPAARTHARAAAGLAGGQAHRGAVPRPRQVQGFRRHLRVVAGGRRRRSTSSAACRAPTAPSCCCACAAARSIRSGATRPARSGWSRTSPIAAARSWNWPTRSATPRPPTAPRAASWPTMSHEIRTPLNGVLGLARLLQDPALPDDAPRRLPGRPGRRARQLLDGIVSDVLDLSKIEAGHLQVEQHPVRPARGRLERVPHVLADRPGARARDELPRRASTRRARCWATRCGCARSCRTTCPTR